jgi:hypothetical protein
MAKAGLACFMEAPQNATDVTAPRWPVNTRCSSGSGHSIGVLSCMGNATKQRANICRVSSCARLARQWPHWRRGGPRSSRASVALVAHLQTGPCTLTDPNCSIKQLF